jgi:hypothetical protein
MNLGALRHVLFGAVVSLLASHSGIVQTRVYGLPRGCVSSY